VSLGDDAASGSFTTCPGEVVAEVGARPEGWLPRSIPIGAYAIFPGRPRRTQGWPVTIAAAKRHLDPHCLPASESQLAGVIDDFEYHDERNARPRNPEIDSFVAVHPRPAHRNLESKATREARDRRWGGGWGSKPLRASSMQGVQRRCCQAMGCAKNQT
jgi:hypothetical protein